MVYRSVVVAKQLYAASAWYGFSTAADRQRLEAVIRRGIRSGLCPVDQTVSELVDAADESLFTQLLQEPCICSISCYLSVVTADMTCDTGTVMEY